MENDIREDMTVEIHNVPASVQLTYTGQAREKFEQAVIAFMRSHGLCMWATGHTAKTNTNDMAFDRAE